MDQIKAIGFDLFNTLITAETGAVREAVTRLTSSLRKDGFYFEDKEFKREYREAALRCIETTRKEGRETHNRFWISGALQGLGFPVTSDDPAVSRAVDAYFSAFLQYCRLIPGTGELLGTLKGFYRLGLLSNFTHPPAALEIIDGLGLASFFDVVLISGDLGYRKPHPMVFRRLLDELGVEGHQALYVGDDPGPDITGAKRAGLNPIWFTYTVDNGITTPPALFSGPSKPPDPGVPRISNWKELLFLLDAKGKKGV